MTYLPGSQRHADGRSQAPQGFALPICRACGKAMEVKMTPRGQRVVVRSRCITTWCPARVRGWRN